MNEDLISRSALLKEIKRIGGHSWSNWETAGVVSMVNAIPAVDAEKVCEQMGLVKEAMDMAKAYLRPVRHGRWVDRPNTKGQVYCSECGTLEKITDNNFKSMHCPNCAAKMDG